MRSGILLAAMAVAIAQPGSIHAGPHLGMKLACKNYAQVWNSGSQSALQHVTTEDFYKQWARMPREAFAKLPRGGTASILSTTKGSGTGTVTVATRAGIMTFHLVGDGFDWKVADIEKRGDDGTPIRLKHYLDISLTASEFIDDLKYRGGSTFHESLSRRFLGEFRRLTPAELERIRAFLPEVEKQKPTISFQQNRATMEVRLPGGGSGDRIVFSFINEQGWKVDDYRVDMEAIQIASFRDALPVLACMTAFSEFTKSPTSCNPQEFTCEGPLREALQYAQKMNPCPIAASGTRERFEISPDLKTVCVCQGGKTVQLSLKRSGDRMLIEEMELQTGGRWMDVAQLLNLQQRVNRMGIASAFASLINDKPATVFANAVETSKTRKPDARPLEVDEPAIKSAVAQEAVQKPAKGKDLVPAVAETNWHHASHQVMPTSYRITSANTKKAYKQWRRSMRRCRQW